MNKISGPLMDRIDLHIEVPAVPFKELASERNGISSEEMRGQVVLARHKQLERFGGNGGYTNAKLTSREIRRFCPLAPEGLALLRSSVHELGLSARAHDKILRVARTIADLQDDEAILTDHVSEAINFRLLDRQLWT